MQQREGPGVSLGAWRGSAVPPDPGRALSRSVPVIAYIGLDSSLGIVYCRGI